MKVQEKAKIFENKVSKSKSKAKPKNFYKDRLKATVCCTNCGTPVHLAVSVKTVTVDLTESDSDEEMPILADARSPNRKAFGETFCIEESSNASRIAGSNEGSTFGHRNLAGLESVDQEDWELEDLDSDAPQVRLSLGIKSEEENDSYSNSDDSKILNRNRSPNTTLTGMNSFARRSPNAENLTASALNDDIVLGGESEDEEFEHSTGNTLDKNPANSDSDEEMPEVPIQTSRTLSEIEILSGDEEIDGGDNDVDAEGLDSLLEGSSDESYSEEF